MQAGPMKFKPIFKERIWGGDRLGRLFGKNLPAESKIGESWELADLPGACSEIEQGFAAGTTLRDVLDKFGAELGFLSEQCKFPFGLLIKFLDARDVLSVQVHPDAQACQRFAGAHLKTECWYVLEAEPGSVIYRGLKPDVSRDLMARAITDGSVEQLLQVYEAKKGDFHFLPAGQIHALGAGVLVAEIQTPSDTTFRVFDWNRRDAQGQSRMLHVEQALESIHYTDSDATDKTNDNAKHTAYPPTAASPKIKPSSNDLQTVGNAMGKSRILTDCPFFSVAYAEIRVGKQEIESPMPIVMIMLSGNGQLKNEQSSCEPVTYRAGDTLLLPAGSGNYIIANTGGESLLTCLGPVKE
ncbi:MAG: class I mannose-6-phosphate isomerase [Sedimentisphaerales bacterium]|nr:class I mannose-6-phosphate isomerase [Sedimentisphaerales bacterium]